MHNVGDRNDPLHDIRAVPYKYTCVHLTILHFAVNLQSLLTSCGDRNSDRNHNANDPTEWSAIRQ